MGLAIGLARMAKSAYRYIRYGKQVGYIHTDGSILYKGTAIGGQKNTKVLVGKNGNVRKVISRKSTLMNRNNRHYEGWHTLTAIPRYGAQKTNIWSVRKTSCYPECREIYHYEYNGSNTSKLGWHFSDRDLIEI